jgi:hypothetical protein
VTGGRTASRGRRGGGRGGRRRGRRALVALLLPPLVLLLAARPAQAVGYRYWSFWQLSHGAWEFAQTGPAATTPSDGDVEGWRFAVSADSANAVRPRGAVGFRAICGATRAAKGTKRVALVLDFGTTADAPDGDNPPREQARCARLPQDASAADALAAVAGPLRYDSSGLVCAISGYPTVGCGEQVASNGTTGGKGANGAAKAPTASGARHGDGPSVGLYAGLGAILVLGAGAAWQARRRRR